MSNNARADTTLVKKEDPFQLAREFVRNNLFCLSKILIDGEETGEYNKEEFRELMNIIRPVVDHCAFEVAKKMVYSEATRFVVVNNQDNFVFRLGDEVKVVKINHKESSSGFYYNVGAVGKITGLDAAPGCVLVEFHSGKFNEQINTFGINVGIFDIERI